MSLGAGRQRAVGEELAETLEDVARWGIGSRVVLVAVPAGWGRSAVLQRFAEVAGATEDPVTLVAQVAGDLLPGRAVQAVALREALAVVTREPWVVRRLGLDTAEGQAQLVLGVGALAAARPVTFVQLVVSLAVTAAGSAWDDSPAGEAGGVARAARALARLSVQVPVVVIIDDADCLDPGLALALIGGLAGRRDGRVLVVAAAAPDSELAGTLTQEPGYDLAAKVQRAEADPSMADMDRAELAVELLPHLPPAGIERIARRTATFTEVFAVAEAGRLAELGPETDTAEAVTVVDAVADAVLKRAEPSPEAQVLAWAGGALHERQARQALQVLGKTREQDDPRVVRAGSLVRLAGPVDGELARLVAILPVTGRQKMAAVVLGEAAGLAADASAGLVDRVVARQAAHHVRDYLADRSGLASVQLGLIRGLEKLGDSDAAYKVATVALAELDNLPPAARDAGQRQDLLMAALRLARTRPGRGQDDDPVTAEAVELAMSGGAAVRTEARVWAAVDLLHRPGHRQDGLRLARQVTAELEGRRIHGDLAAQWRLLLAFHTGQAGDTALAYRLLATMIGSGPQSQRDAAAAVGRAIKGSHADTRLQIILLQDELARTPADADDDLLRLHHALAANYDTLGEYHPALYHASQELPLRRRIQGDNHPDTLATRGNIAFWTGECGELAVALRLFRELLSDRIRIQGPDHPDTLAVRSNIASSTGRCGDLAGALHLFQELLLDQVRVLGSGHPNTLANRNNIAHWTGRCGDPAEALHLFQKLLPDRIRVLGSGHPNTLTTRSNIAHWTGECGDPAEALRLFQELLPDQVRVLGPDHPDTLATRSNIAGWTGRCGDPAEALRLAQDLVPDQVRVLGPDHPDTLITRNNIASSTGKCGDPAEALRLFQELLPDQMRRLGPDHPDTLATRKNIDYGTKLLSASAPRPEGTIETEDPGDTGALPLP